MIRVDQSLSFEIRGEQLKSAAAEYLGYIDGLQALPSLDLRTRSSLYTIRADIGNILPGRSLEIDVGIDFDNYKFLHVAEGRKSALVDEQYVAEETWRDLESKTRNTLMMLGGDRVELDSSRSGVFALVKDRDDWISWKEGTESGRKYREEIYPTVVRYLSEYFLKASGDFRAVDLFGGDAEFIQDLSSKLCRENQDARFWWSLVDGDNNSLGAARKLLGGERQGRIFDNTNLEIHMPIDLTNKRKRRRLFGSIGKSDLVTVIGGLNWNVIGSQDAIEITEDIKNMLLNKNGTLVITGLTFTHINREILERLGFVVENMSVPENIFTRIAPYQLYIARKSEDKPLCEEKISPLRTIFSRIN